MRIKPRCGTASGVLATEAHPNHFNQEDKIQ